MIPTADKPLDNTAEVGTKTDDSSDDNRNLRPDFGPDQKPANLIIAMLDGQDMKPVQKTTFKPSWMAFLAVTTCRNKVCKVKDHSGCILLRLRVELARSHFPHITADLYSTEGSTFLTSSSLVLACVINMSAVGTGSLLLSPVYFSISTREPAVGKDPER